MAAAYRFLTTWCLDAPIDRVWDLLNDAQRYPRWWKGVSVQLLRAGDETGIGQVTRLCCRSTLPYTLRFDMRVTQVERPHLIVGEATGELEGRGVCRLFEGAGTAVVYDWQVRTTRPGMNLLGAVARPALLWNHDRVMRQGGFGLADELGAHLIAHD